MSSTLGMPSDPAGEIAAAGDARFRALIEHSADVVSLLDARGRLLYTSPAATRLLGYAADEVAALYRRGLVHPDDRDQVEQAFEAALMRPEESIAYEVRLRHKDGSWRLTESVITNHLDDPGVQALVVNSHDCTAQRQSEAELRASRDQLQAILQSAADGITVQDMNGRLLYANEAAARLIGYPSVPSLLSADPSTRIQQFRVFDETGEPYDLSRLPGRLALEEKRTAEAVMRYEVIPTGEERWSHVRATPVLDRDGTVVFAVTAFQDITRLKQVEAGLRYLAETGALLATSLDYETTLQNVARLAVPALADTCVVDLLDDDGSLRRFAVSMRQGKNTKPVWEVDRSPLNPEAEYGPAHVLRTGVSELVAELTDEILVTAARDAEHLKLLRRAGLQSHMIVPLRSRGRLLGLLTFLTVGSERRYGSQDLVLAEELADRAALAVDNARLYREAQNALADAQAALSSRDRFLSVASHELRTPLTSLKGQLQLSLRRLQRGNVDGVGADLVIADRQATRLGLLVNQLLDVSRLESGQFTIAAEPVDLRPLLERTVEAEQAIEPARVIELMIADALPPVQADPARLEQVLINLLENARKYSPREQPIHVSVSSTDETATIAVRDHGIGIPPEDQARVFEPFSRAANVDSGVLGIGLYIVAQIVQAHGGTLSVESTPGEGSTFLVTLPLDGPPAAS